MSLCVFKGEGEREREREIGVEVYCKGKCFAMRYTCEHSIARGEGNTQFKVGCILFMPPYKIKHSFSKACFFVLSDHESHQFILRDFKSSYMPKFDL